MIAKISRPKVDRAKMLSVILDRPKASTLKKISKTKKFVMSVLEGQSIADAKLKAGYSPATPTSQIMAQPVARLVMKSLVEKEFHDAKYVNKLKQLWDATDRRATKDGDIYETPNWPAQIAALDRVSELRDLTEKAVDERQPQGITVQIVGEGNVHLKNLDVP